MPDEISTDWRLQQLAKYFATNIICHSVNDNTEIKDVSNEMLTNGYDEKFAKSRNILIIGAGTSYNASCSIPLANKFVKTLKEEFDKEFKPKGSKVSLLTNQLEYLSRAYNLQPTEFETIMLACSRFDNEWVLSKLKEKYDIKHLPNLFFELVAHMFKHRFIDVIINFNFDEALDNAIQEEMSGQEYHSIISDGDLTEEFDNLMFGHRLKKPMYIKPHGTISHPSSMRFNKEHYFALPSRIAKTLENLFVGSYTDTVEEQEKNESKKSRQKRSKYLSLNFIVAGFGMQSHDLNFILNKALKERDRIGNNTKNKKASKKPPPCKFFVFDIDTDKDRRNYIKDLRKTSLFDGLPDYYQFDEVGEKEDPEKNHFITIIPIFDKADALTTKKDFNTLNADKEKTTLENKFFQLFNTTKFLFEEQHKTKIRRIERHLVITELFRKPWDKEALRLFESTTEAVVRNGIRSEYYLTARLYVELAILMVHSEGIINLTQLKESRFNKYYSLLQQLYDVLDKAKDSNLRPKNKLNLEYFIKSFDLHKYKYFAKDTFQYSTADYNAEKIAENLIQILNELTEQTVIKWKEVHKSNPDIIEIDEVNLINQKHIIQYFSDFKSNPDWEIKATFQEHNLTKFNTVTAQNFLHTDLRFSRYRQKFFADKDWDVVLSLTKRASFLNEEKQIESELTIGSSKKKMLLILADFQQGKPITNEKQTFKPWSDRPQVENPNLNIKYQNLHWSLHNQQMHLFLKFDKSKFDSGINDDLDNTIPDHTKALEEFNRNLDKSITLMRGIYYQRRMLSRKANPIYFDFKSKDPHAAVLDDLIEMFDVFVNYYSRARSQSAHAIEDYKCFVQRKYELFLEFESSV